MSKERIRRHKARNRNLDPMETLTAEFKERFFSIHITVTCTQCDWSQIGNANGIFNDITRNHGNIIQGTILDQCEQHQYLTGHSTFALENGTHEGSLYVPDENSFSGSISKKASA
jgi:hypothetical protein